MRYTVYYGDEKTFNRPTLDECIEFCYSLYRECGIDYAYIKSHYTAVDFEMDNGYIRPLYD